MSGSGDAAVPQRNHGGTSSYFTHVRLTTVPTNEQPVCLDCVNMFMLTLVVKLYNLLYYIIFRVEVKQCLKNMQVVVNFFRQYDDICLLNSLKLLP